MRTPCARFSSLIALMGAAALVACSDAPIKKKPADPSDESCVSHDECGGETPLCLENACAARPAGWQLGIGDGSATSVGMAWLYAPDAPRETTDVAFDTVAPDRLWVLMREFESPNPCTMQDPSGCASLEGRTAILDRPGTEETTVQVIKDPNAWHFMRRPTSIAFGRGESFATCHEHRTGNGTDDIFDYIGPSLWSSNLAIYGIQPPGLNGSHLDMLHNTPYCMGIAWERDNLYWLFNGNVGAIDKVDFQADHGPGHDDHSDGQYWRYVEGQLSRVPTVPSHLHVNGKWLYIADTGNARVVRLDTTSGTQGGPFSPINDPLDTRHYIDGAVLEEIVPPGTLEQPSGLVTHDGVLFVSDYATSRIHAFDLEGNPLNSLQLDLPPGSVTGLEIGPDQRLVFVEKPTGNVFRILPF
jgi:hypothetical protein